MEITLCTHVERREIGATPKWDTTMSLQKGGRGYFKYPFFCVLLLLQYCIRRGLNRIMGAMIEHPLRMPLSRPSFFIWSVPGVNVLFVFTAAVSWATTRIRLFYFPTFLSPTYFTSIFPPYISGIRDFYSSFYNFFVECFGVFVLYRVKNVVSQLSRHVIGGKFAFM